MKIRINGEMREDVPDGLDVAGLLRFLRIAPEKVAVEHNLAIVPLSRWNETRLNEGDEIEIVRFVGGG